MVFENPYNLGCSALIPNKLRDEMISLLVQVGFPVVRLPLSSSYL